MKLDNRFTAMSSASKRLLASISRTISRPIASSISTAGTASGTGVVANCGGAWPVAARRVGHKRQLSSRTTSSPSRARAGAPSATTSTSRRRPAPPIGKNSSPKASLECRTGRASRFRSAQRATGCQGQPGPPVGPELTDQPGPNGGPGGPARPARAPGSSGPQGPSQASLRPSSLSGSITGPIYSNWRLSISRPDRDRRGDSQARKSLYRPLRPCNELDLLGAGVAHSIAIIHPRDQELVPRPCVGRRASHPSR